MEVRRQLLKPLNAGQEFRAILRDLHLTPNVVWGLTKTDAEWAESLGGALEATRREDLEHGTNAAYVQGCVCSECRETSAFAWPRTVDVSTVARRASGSRTGPGAQNFFMEIG
jgi:hypothetical protein